MINLKAKLSVHLDDRVSIPGIDRDFISLTADPDYLCDPPNLLSKGNFSTGVRRPEREPNHSPLVSSEVKNA
jgi:hypothetical protein